MGFPAKGSRQNSIFVSNLHLSHLLKKHWWLIKNKMAILNGTQFWGRIGLGAKGKSQSISFAADTFCLQLVYVRYNKYPVNVVMGGYLAGIEPAASLSQTSCP